MSFLFVAGRDTSSCYNSRMRLADNLIVVTGASGIAAAGAMLLAREGASIFVVSRGAGECESLVGEIEAAGGHGYWAAADLTDEAEAGEAFARVSERFDRVDGLFAVAGGSGRRFGDGPIHEMDLAAWESTLKINLRPAFLAAQQAIRIMRTQDKSQSGTRGSIVLVSSVLAEHPAPELFGTHAYAASKGAINSLTKTLASYYAGDGIRVNSLAPGLVKTPMSERAMADPATVEYSRRKQPLTEGFLEASQIAAAAAFLLSNESVQITGQVLSVDGGWGVTEIAP